MKRHALAMALFDRHHPAHHGLPGGLIVAKDVVAHGNGLDRPYAFGRTNPGAPSDAGFGSAGGEKKGRRSRGAPVHEGCLQNSSESMGWTWSVGKSPGLFQKKTRDVQSIACERGCVASSVKDAQDPAE